MQKLLAVIRSGLAGQGSEISNQFLKELLKIKEYKYQKIEYLR